MRKDLPGGPCAGCRLQALARQPDQDLCSITQSCNSKCVAHRCAIPASHPLCWQRTNSASLSYEPLKGVVDALPSWVVCKALVCHMLTLGPGIQAGTLSGNPLAMVAGLKTLEILDRPGTYEYLEKITERLITGLLKEGKEAGHDVCGGHISGTPPVPRACHRPGRLQICL